MTAAASITVRVPLAIQRRPGRKTVVTPVWDGSEATLPTRVDPTLVKALARAHRWQRMLEDGRYASISEMAAAERIERGYLGTLLRLTLLAPDIVEAILDGRRALDLGLAGLLEPLPVEWERQRENLRMAQRRGGRRLPGPVGRPRCCSPRDPDSGGDPAYPQQ